MLLPLGVPSAALAQFATDWQLGFQSAVTPVMEEVASFHDMLLWIIIGISAFVLALLLIVMFRFNEKTNPTPSRTTHNTVVELLWTVIPVVILVVIAVPSFKLLYAQDTVPEADMTVKATGHQWYWSYEYPDNGDISFDSILIEDPAELDKTENKLRLLETDTAVVVPVDATVRMIVTSADVIHSWAVPSFGVKVDAVPGRLNETWFKATETGTYYGQCSELCGVRHAYMPIKIKVVPREEFNAWVEKTMAKSDAGNNSDTRRLARLQTPTR